MGMLKERLSTFVTKNMISMTFKLIKFDTLVLFEVMRSAKADICFWLIVFLWCQVFVSLEKKERTNMYKGEMIPYAYLIHMVNVVKESILTQTIFF